MIACRETLKFVVDLIVRESGRKSGQIWKQVEIVQKVETNIITNDVKLSRRIRKDWTQGYNKL